MTKSEQLRLAYSQSESRRQKIQARRRFVEELDEQIEAAMKRWELSLSGVDAHKAMAEEVTDDEEHAVAVTTVYDWLSRRNGRRPPAEVLSVLYEADPGFAAWWNMRHGYTVPEKLTRISWEQERALLRRALQEFGSVGEQKLRAISVAKPDGAP